MSIGCVDTVSTFYRKMCETLTLLKPLWKIKQPLLITAMFRTNLFSEVWTKITSSRSSSCRGRHLAVPEDNSLPVLWSRLVNFSKTNPTGYIKLKSRYLLLGLCYTILTTKMYFLNVQGIKVTILHDHLLEVFSNQGLPCLQKKVFQVLIRAQ